MQTSTIKRGLLASAIALPTTVIASIAHAQTTDACTPGSIVHYVNGIRTDSEGASLDAEALKATINLTTSGGAPVKYYHTWNPTNGFQGIGDIEESIIQWVRQRGSEPGLLTFAQEAALMLARSVRSGGVDAFLRVLQSAIPGTVDDAFISSFRLFIAVEAARLVSAEGRSDVVAQAVKQQMQNFLQQGNRVILVSHSQGNFVANEAYDALPANLKSSVRRVGVAVPSSTISGGGPYTTLRKDFIRLVFGAVAPNTPTSGEQTQACPGYETLNHSFVGCYLPNSGFAAGTEARGKVLSGVQGGLSLPLPPVVTRLGNIVATLTWQTPADVDLHAYEPGGAHVYYGATQGTTAQLDRDDTVGTGPENIFVCGNPAVGSYRFGVNYYSGTAAQTATVVLNGGGVTRPFNVPLTSGIGSAGNTPPAFGQVIVTRSSSGVYSYEIR